MSAAISFLIILVLSLLIVRVATVALVLTGLRLGLRAIATIRRCLIY